ncbi:MAG: class I SAM-dependent methyltransferase [Betaproteobacteria bacterium]
MNASTPGITADEQVARIFEWRRGFNNIHLIDTGIELGLFAALATAPGLTAEALAEKLELRIHPVRTWCWTAHGQALLDSDEAGGFRLAPHMDAILANPGHPRYLGGYAQLGTRVAAEDFRRSLQTYRTGEINPFQGRGEGFAHLIAQSTWGLQIATARKILPGVEGLVARLEAGGTVLEVGCGTGNFLIQTAKAFPAARAIGVDLDADSLAIAERRIADAGFGERTMARLGAVEDVVTPGSVDAVVMIEVLHEIDQALRPSVIRQCAQALKPGGWLVVVDETYPSTLAQTREAEFRFPLQTGIEELTWGNVIPTREEQESLLRDAQFAEPFGRMLIGEGFTVLTARRP